MKVSSRNVNVINSSSNSNSPKSVSRELFGLNTASHIKKTTTVETFGFGSEQKRNSKQTSLKELAECKKSRSSSPEI